MRDDYYKGFDSPFKLPEGTSDGFENIVDELLLGVLSYAWRGQ